MQLRIPQSVAIRVPLKAYLSSDHLSDAVSKTLAVVISKNAAGFGNPSAGATNATEVGGAGNGLGWYYVDLSTTDTGTLGPLIVRATAGTVDNVELAYQVVDATNLGASNLDASVASRSTYAGGAVASVTGAVGSVTGLTASDVGAIKAKTDNLPASPAATGAKMDLVDAPNATAVTAIQSGLSKPGTAQTITSNADVTAIKAKTDNLPASPAAVGSNMGTVTSVTGSVGSVASYGSLVSDIWAYAVEGSYTAVQTLRGLLSMILGKVSGAGTTTFTMRDASDTKNRVVCTVSLVGDRTDFITKDLT